MRSAILAVLASLWIFTSPAHARNGETGILIFIRTFEVVQDDIHQQPILLLCQDDLDRIIELIEEGYDTRIYLRGYGVFDVEANESDNFRLHIRNMEIQAKPCHPHGPSC